VRLTDNSFSIYGGWSIAMTGSTTPNTLYGAYITDFAGTGLLFASRFDTPVAMVDAFSLAAGRYSLNLPVNGLTGGALVIP
jgi:hypothetical protein